MPFATRADLLARCNVQRLWQLAVPTDMQMVADEHLRSAIEGDAETLPDDEQKAVDAALEAIDSALGDAEALLLSFGVPPDIDSEMVKRWCCSLAMYYLHGDNPSEAVLASYKAILDLLKRYQNDELTLVPVDPELTDDVAIIESAPRRFGRVPEPGDW